MAFHSTRKIIFTTTLNPQNIFIYITLDWITYNHWNTKPKQKKMNEATKRRNLNELLHFGKRNDQAFDVKQQSSLICYPKCFKISSSEIFGVITERIVCTVICVCTKYLCQCMGVHQNLVWCFQELPMIC